MPADKTANQRRQRQLSEWLHGYSVGMDILLAVMFWSVIVTRDISWLWIWLLLVFVVGGMVTLVRASSLQVNLTLLPTWPAIVCSLMVAGLAFYTMLLGTNHWLLGLVVGLHRSLRTVQLIRQRRSNGLGT